MNPKDKHNCRSCGCKHTWCVCVSVCTLYTSVLYLQAIALIVGIVSRSQGDYSIPTEAKHVFCGPLTVAKR